MDSMFPHCFPRILLALLLALSVDLRISVRAENPSQASGPNGNFSFEGTGPRNFSVSRGEGVLWRAPLPNTGQGTAIVSRGRVFVTSHTPTEGDATTGSTILGLCFDAETGKELWRRDLPGSRETDLSSLFSDNTAATPVADGERVCFTNVGGSMRCFDYEGNELWSKTWVPFGRHHSRQHEPFYHGGNVIVLRVKPSDLSTKVTTKEGAKPLGRDRKVWTFLHAYKMETGELAWIADAGTSVHATSLLGRTENGTSAILTGRGGGHQPPEEPYGISLVNASNGRTIWDLQVARYAAHQNASWNQDSAALFAGTTHYTVSISDGKMQKDTALDSGVQVFRTVDGGRRILDDQKLDKFKRPMTHQSNLLVGDYHYFRAHGEFWIGRVHIRTGKVEYLEVPVQVSRHAGRKDETRWRNAIPNDMRNSAGNLATQDKRNAGNGWGHVSSASPIVVGDLIYLPTMIGMVYVLRWDSPQLDDSALVSISDLGIAGETWSLSSLYFEDGRLYARTLKELICIGTSNEP